MGYGEARSVPQTQLESLFGTLGRGTSNVRDYLNSKIYHKSGFGLGDLMMGQAPEMLDDMSWGKSIIQPTGHGGKLDPRIADVAELAAIAAIPAKKFAKHGLKEFFKARHPARTQLGAIIRRQKDYDDLVKKGYNMDDWYHGSPKKGLTEFKKQPSRFKGEYGDPEGLYITADKDLATDFSRLSVDEFGKNIYGKKGGEVYKVYHKLDNPLNITDDINERMAKGEFFGDARLEALKKVDYSKHDGVIFDGNAITPPERIIFDPSKVYHKDPRQHIGRKWTKKEAQQMFLDNMETDTVTAGDFDVEQLLKMIYRKTGHNLAKDKKSIFKIKHEYPSATKERFLELGDLQRGKPEQAMLELQRTMGGGVMNPAVEHIGDITHRMTHMLKWGDDKYKTGWEFVKEKVDKSLHSLKHPYGFAKEMEENLASNAKFYKIDEGAFRAKVKLKMMNYAYEHKQLPVYNSAQRHARDAAVSLGEGDFKKTIEHLEELKKHLNTPDEWHKYAMENLNAK